MEKSTIGLGIALVAALIGSYLSWTHEEVAEREEDSAIAWQLEPSAIKKISWEKGTTETIVEQRSDTLGDYLWVETTTRVEIPTTQPNAAPNVKSKTKSFKAGLKSGEELLERFAPFQVRRNLGTADKKEYGFDDDTGTLAIEAGETKTYDVGGTGYGQRHTYIREQGAGTVYAVKSRAFKPFQSATKQLMERQLFPFPPQEIREVEISANDKRYRFLQENAQDSAAAFWSTGDKTPQPAVRIWMENKFFPLQIRDFETPVEGLEPLFAAKIVPIKGEPIVVEFFRGDPTKKFQYARSTFTRGLVSVEGNAITDALEDFVQNVAQEP